MAKLTPEEIGKHHAALSEWQFPDEMIERVSQISCHIGAETFFNQTGLNFLREAWCASRFAKTRKASHVRLVHPDPPDFMIRINEKDEGFELVEADIPGRRRGLEYRGLSKNNLESEPYSADDWIKEKSQISTSIRNAVTKKIQKTYSSETSLLILLNIIPFGIATTSEINEIEATLRAEAKPALVKFQQVWTFWDGRAYEIA